MENKENVSVSLGSHNRDINEKHLIGCKRVHPLGGFLVRYCDECYQNLCLDGLCFLDNPFSPMDIEPIYKEVCDE